MGRNRVVKYVLFFIIYYLIGILIFAASFWKSSEPLNCGVTSFCSPEFSPSLSEIFKYPLFWILMIFWPILLIMNI
ncbi:hypothetical protein A3D01_05800 [Candidatus Woesebacteria bacterium RIFCSPHIGHO2_02_FULL_39_13]|uniref:Vitamin K epoxide reductase domain-containing protein n=1 Tax=Candidatus Woesebacteria bacterium RIFCSPHIGHO2_02_FULL_39_13 TaxID=1802505 RepID=A0A1F7Z2M9_9BACT|nr:MAG: hypothetical protein A3D01_05800 [Candidatus Woesebacteria bacterium RIFCSPHIGHO2_02_FULL_39_13]OGM37195.1 MAG: hypothetical protein A3E13_03130 [Candidatus Woesebacteria bacterium RIFCSPHIGHO2_12_FULL_40_20]OGM74063.1 MAG: hypothetical protein A3H19_02445 [Candidatus Woesebacteria bacterium RIFCSPLOWO2_12_FULL_39_9]